MYGDVVIMPLGTVRRCCYSDEVSLHLLSVLTEAGCPITFGSMIKGLPAKVKIFALSMPGLECRILQCLTIGKADPPEIGVHGEIKKFVVTLWVMRHFFILQGASRARVDFCDPAAASKNWCFSKFRTCNALETINTKTQMLGFLGGTSTLL